jgi:TrmH family RNA methyltransferase
VAETRRRAILISSRLQHYISDPNLEMSMLNNIEIILVGTKYAGNLGSVARAMHNMGLGRLRLAAPHCRVDDEAIRMARSGNPVLPAARTFRSLDSALRGIRLVVGTTGKRGGQREQNFSARSLAPEILSHAEKQKVGIVFGPEDTGLVDEDLMRCQWLLRIPTQSQAHSLNLAQAVMIVSYELYLGQLRIPPERVPALAGLDQIEAMYQQLEESLRTIGFLHDDNARHMMSRVRRLLGRTGLERSDVGILRGIARQIAWLGRQAQRHTDRQMENQE